MVFKDCHLYKEGYCTCYLKKCIEVSDCAPKLTIKKNMNRVKEILNR